VSVIGAPSFRLINGYITTLPILSVPYVSTESKTPMLSTTLSVSGCFACAKLYNPQSSGHKYLA
jgi:hypothetical protein